MALLGVKCGLSFYGNTLYEKYLDVVKSTGFPSKDHLTLIGLSPSGLHVSVTGKPIFVVKLAPTVSKCTGSRKNFTVSMLLL